MSGGPLEITGVVLGALPVVILALETRAALRRWRGSAADARALARALRTEQARLRLVLERLLRDPVADALVGPMIEDPFGCALWRKPAVAERVRRRLGGRDYELFGECVEGVGECVGELRGLLEGGGGGAGRGGLRFVLWRGRECREVMGRLREGVAGLEGLVVGNMEMEGRRRRVRRRASVMGLWGGVGGLASLSGLGGGVGCWGSLWRGGLSGGEVVAREKEECRPVGSPKGAALLREVFKGQGIQIVLSSVAGTGWGGGTVLWKMMALTAVVSTRCRASGRRVVKGFVLPPPGENDVVEGSGGTVNSTLMAVGVLLIEVALGERVDREGSWYRGLLAAAAAADAGQAKQGALVEKVNTLSSSGYHGVLRRCVGQDMTREEGDGQPGLKDVKVEIIVS
ncbi:hypothetical protein QBC39DRAFT_418197 [Podospora conica]|nr:hypothetical protein QBC39DRAFT_418197 [Schizothecium conicum]